MKKIILLFLVVGLTSCEDFLKEVPKDTLTTNNFYNTSSDAIAAVNAVYARLNSGMYNRNFYLYTDLFTDDATAGVGVNNPFIRAVDNFTHEPVNDRFDTAWREHYDGINRANEVIKNVPDIQMNTALRDRVVGEAKFLRGLLYFNLVRLFGDVPLVLEPTSSTEGLNVSQSPVPAIYDQVIKDLTDAENTLAVTYTGLDVGRATKGAATAMLARVYLTQKDWQKAAAKCKQLIDSKTYELWDDYAKVFQVGTENQKEAIFSVQFASGISNGNTMMRLAFPRGRVPGIVGNEADVPTPDLVKAFEAGDARGFVTLRNSYEANGRTFTFNHCFFKYFDPAMVNATNDSGINYPVIRYADVLLMYAEALNELNGPTAEAYQYLNSVRRRARKSPTALPDASGLTKDGFRDAVLNERRLEFAFEGIRWFDLVRTGRMVTVMTKHGKPAKEFHNLLPIPQREMDTNPSLKQNSGY